MSLVGRWSLVVGRLVAAPVVDTNKRIELASLTSSTVGNLWVTVRCWTARVLPCTSSGNTPDLIRC